MAAGVDVHMRPPGLWVLVQGLLLIAAESNINALMRQIDALGHGTPEYHEAMWFLLSVLARKQYAMADSIRTNARRRDRAAATRRAAKSCP